MTADPLGVPVHHVVPRLHEEASGTSHTVPGMCDALARIGVDVTLHVLRARPGIGDGFKLCAHPAWPGLERLGVAPAMSRAVHQAARAGAILHNNSLWMMPNVYPGRAARATGCKLVVSPRGTMSDWAWNRSRARKRVIWAIGQRHTIERASLFHVTADSECDEIRDRGVRTPVVIIPNGTDLAPASVARPARSARRNILFLSRVHPKKGVDLLLECWRDLQDDFPDWSLSIVGPDAGSGYLDEMRALANRLGCARTTLPGPAYSETKWHHYADAGLFVLPTHSENFGIAVSEAMSAGVPAIVTHGAPWGCLETERAGWWIERSRESLTATLRTALSLSDDEREAMGARGDAYARAAFSWERAAAQMLAAYAWLLGKGPEPETLRRDPKEPSPR